MKDVKKFILLFDLDGTLTDPKTGICTCVQYALASLGIEEPDLDKLEAFIGPPLKQSFMEFYHLTDSQADAAVEKYRERFEDRGLYENRPYKGIRSMLRALSNEGMIMGVASSKPTVYVRRILKYFGIAHYFTVIVGSELDGRRADKKEVVEEALRQLYRKGSVIPKYAYMIGDRSFDVKGAHSMGIESVGVTYGYGSMEELKEAKSDYIVRSVKELRSFLLREARKTYDTGVMLYAKAMLALALFQVAKYSMILLAQRILVRADKAGMGPFVLYDEAGNPEIMLGNAVCLALASGYAAAAAMMLLMARKFLAYTAEDMKLFHLKREPKRSYILLIIAVLGTALGLNMLLELTGVTALSVTYPAVEKSQYAAPLWLGLICYGVAAPIAEELLFRGYIYGSLRRNRNLVRAMIVSAGMFGVYHGNIPQAIYAFAMGCLIVFAYEYFGDFRYAVGIHMGANMVVYCLGRAGFAGSGAFGIPLCVICLMCAAGSIYLLWREKRGLIF